MSRKEQYVHSEKPLEPRQLRIKSRLLPFALPRLPPKVSMLLLPQQFRKQERPGLQHRSPAIENSVIARQHVEGK